MTTDLADASARAAEGQWANAQIAIDRAQFASQIAPSLFSNRELQGFGQMINEAEAKLRAAQERSMLGVDPVIERRIEEAFVRRHVIPDLNRTADQLLREGRYSEALQTLRQVLILDPDNAHAQACFPDALLECPWPGDSSDDE